jgi:hypothetical protein
VERFQPSRSDDADPIDSNTPPVVPLAKGDKESMARLTKRPKDVASWLPTDRYHSSARERWKETHLQNRERDAEQSR